MCNLVSATTFLESKLNIKHKHLHEVRQSLIDDSLRDKRQFVYDFDCTPS